LIESNAGDGGALGGFSVELFTVGSTRHSGAMHEWISTYLDQQKAALESIPADGVAQLVETFRRAWREDRQIFVFGNGGSAASASHFVTDLGKGASDKLSRRFRVMSINDNTPWITALGNDYAYDQIFVKQLANFARPHDVVLAMSVSGNSPNLVKAFEWANEHEVETVALVGAKRGKLAELARQCIVIDSEHYGRVEDAHMTICHLLAYAFMEIPAITQPS
jgi:D-sedoheptulose 7-phosphate isomerase